MVEVRSAVDDDDRLPSTDFARKQLSVFNRDVDLTDRMRMDGKEALIGRPWKISQRHSIDFSTRVHAQDLFRERNSYSVITFA